MTVSVMTEPLSDHDLARLHAKFVVPIVVDQMLRDEEPLDDIAEHAMNEILCEFYPDTALLCLAMCARHIARETAFLPISRALAIQAGQIIDEYGPIWIAHEKNQDSLDDTTIQDLLTYIPEDFESLRDLLEATMAALEEDHSIAAILCDILSQQADFHRDIAESELLALHLRPQSRETETASTAPASDNIIPFPSRSRRSRQTVRG